MNSCEVAVEVEDVEVNQRGQRRVAGSPRLVKQLNSVQSAPLTDSRTRPSVRSGDSDDVSEDS